MRITVIGAGYVGLTTGICFSHLGHHVLVVEKLPEKVAMLKDGKLPIYEPGLEDLLLENLSRKRISFTTSVEESVGFSDVVFISVGTPQNQDGSADLSQVEEVARTVATHMESYKLLVEKSTVPVNTHKLIKKTVLRSIKREVDFDVASNPEFLREGSAVRDFLEPDRIVVGVESERAKDLFKEVYKDIKAPIIFTDPATAELIKHASNSFLAMKISFINMIADLCEKTGADIKLVADGMGYDKRIGRSFLNAGVGWGGSCFPKDVKAFIKIAENYGVDFSLLKEVERINISRVKRFIEKVQDVLWSLKGKKLALWGLAFKPDTDDIREAPSLKIVSGLLEQGAKVYAYDPKAMENFKRVFPKINYGNSMYEVLKDADALLIITEWEEFLKADLFKVKSLMRLPIIIDGRNVYEPSYVREFGFEYYPMGRS
ncbi:MAG: UDP-glucose dehydrogenase family protein [Aquificaceae bacterium]